MMKTQAIIVMAGTGDRFKGDQPKLFASLHGKAVFLHAVDMLQICPLIDSIILVVHKDWKKKIVEILNLKTEITKVVNIVEGGATRSESVGRGLKVLAEETDIVLIHDGARPLVTMKMIEDTIKGVQSSSAVTLAVPVKSTIKVVDEETLIVLETLDRRKLWEIQTPQTFQKQVILGAHERNKTPDPTDDASMVEALGIKVKVIQGDYQNIKITTREDIGIAEALLKQREG
jgi:2-C-methyl-D-erythritol 4-phosphate cytidylyltransferase